MAAQIREIEANQPITVATFGSQYAKVYMRDQTVTGNVALRCPKTRLEEAERRKQKERLQVVLGNTQEIHCLLAQCQPLNRGGLRSRLDSCWVHIFPILSCLTAH